jgi:hypothetical protein
MLQVKLNKKIIIGKNEFANKNTNKKIIRKEIRLLFITIKIFTYDFLNLINQIFHMIHTLFPAYPRKTIFTKNFKSKTLVKSFSTLIIHINI